MCQIDLSCVANEALCSSTDLAAVAKKAKHSDSRSKSTLFQSGQVVQDWWEASFYMIIQRTPGPSVLVFCQTPGCCTHFNMFKIGLSLPYHHSN